MDIINIRNLQYNNYGIIGTEGIIHTCNNDLFKKFHIMMPKETKRNKEIKLKEIDKIEELKKFYNKLLGLVYNYTNEFLSGYIISKSEGLPLNEVFLLPEEKIEVLMELKKILLEFNKYDIKYDDIHFDNIYYNYQTKKLELIDIDNIQIGDYKRDIDSFLIRDYYMYGGKNDDNARIYCLNLITYMLMIGRTSNYDIKELRKTMNRDQIIFENSDTLRLCKELLQPKIDSSCDHEYLIDMLDREILIKK